MENNLMPVRNVRNVRKPVFMRSAGAGECAETRAGSQIPEYPPNPIRTVIRTSIRTRNPSVYAVSAQSAQSAQRSNHG
jgi:hypothetical protein